MIKKILLLAILTIGLVSCSDDSDDNPNTQTITERLKGDLFQEVTEGSVLSVEKTRFYEGVLKQDDCWQTTDYKIVMTNETYDTMYASLTSDDVTISMEFYLSPSGKSLNVKIFDSEYVFNYDYNLIEDCFNK